MTHQNLAWRTQRTRDNTKVEGMTELSRKQMEAILLTHEIAELESDVEATLATLAENPHYEIAMLGLAVDGIDAVRELYKRILPKGNQDVAAKARVHAMAKNTLVREAVMSFNNTQGERVTGLYIVVMEFDPETGLISGERMYADPNFGGMMAEQIGEDFVNFPGVSVIGEDWDPIERHDAYDFAEKRGLTINAPS